MRMVCGVVAAIAVVLAGAVMPALALVPIRPRPPVAPPGYVYEWVPPVYDTVMDRVWVPERIEMVRDWLETWPGHWEQVWRQVVVPGHWQTTTRQVLVSAGYWRLVRVDGPPPVIVPFPRPVFGWPGTVGVDGYSSGPVEDLSKFSGLSEWPK